MELKKIVITGGPCAGKTSALAVLKAYFSEKGYNVLIVNETATQLISGGVSAKSLGSDEKFQRLVMELQLKKEEIYLKAAKAMNKDKTLIIYDRGTVDNRAYLSADEYEKLLRDENKTIDELLSYYDAVIHLVTAADKAESFYTTENNRARTETPEEARQRDKKIIEAWSRHKSFHIIDNSTDFEGKLRRITEAIEKLIS